ncbi:MAG TPA: outer membrane beta-barrel protein [Saprospiraceae bacterium]|nr:outer membrane beta-barrel protein [Saprospiraceae bacterium]
MKWIISPIIVILLSISSTFAQSGAVLSVGLSLMDSKNLKITKSGQHHNGWHASLTGRFGPDFWYLRTGLELHKIALSSSNTIELFQDIPHTYLLKIPVQIGARLIKTDLFKLRLAAGGQVSYISVIQDNDQNLNHNTMSDLQFGILGTIGIDLNNFTLDLSYEKGITELYTDTGFEANYWIMSAGFFF